MCDGCNRKVCSAVEKVHGCCPKCAGKGTTGSEGRKKQRDRKALPMQSINQSTMVSCNLERAAGVGGVHTCGQRRGVHRQGCAVVVGTLFFTSGSKNPYYAEPMFSVDHQILIKFLPALDILTLTTVTESEQTDEASGDTRTHTNTHKQMELPHGHSHEFSSLAILSSLPPLRSRANQLATSQAPTTHLNN